MPQQLTRRQFTTVAAAAGASMATGCVPSREEEVVVFTALDREFSAPIFEDFTRQSGIAVRPKYDTESTKSVGLTNALLAQENRPVCDVFWNNEILGTLRLQKAGRLAAYKPEIAEAFPGQFRSPQGLWHGFAARARVLLCNTKRLPDNGNRPASVLDLVDQRWQGRAALARPLFRTTATHAACLFAKWGSPRAKAFFQSVHRRAQVLSGNKQVAEAVAAGEVDFGLTDTDDAMIEIEAGRPVEIVYPDQSEGQLGTLFIPNTVAMIDGGPHPEAAKRLTEYLLSPEIEARLAVGPSAQIPLNPAVTADVRVATPREIRAMQIDFDEAAAQWDTAASFLSELFAA